MQLYTTPLKARRLRDMHSAVTQHSVADSVATYDDVVLAPRGQIVGAYLEETPGRIVDDGDYCADILPATDETDTEFEHFNAVYCGYMRHPWGHFLTNTLSRLWYVLHAPADTDLYIFCSDNGDTALTGNHLETLCLLDIADRVRIVTRPTRFRRLTVPALGLGLDTGIAPEYMQMVQHICRAALQHAPAVPHDKRLLLTRAAWSSADIGIGAIDAFYRDNGYAVVCPEHLSVTEMIARLQHADDVAIYSGSAAHNAIFCHPGTRLHLIERCATNNIYQPMVNVGARLHPIYVEANLAPLSIAYGGGPVLYYPTPHMLSYAEAEGMQAPAPPDSGTLRRQLRRYLTLHRRRYGHFPVFDSWSADDAAIFIERQGESRRLLSERLDLRGPITVADYLNPRLWARRLLGRR